MDSDETCQISSDQNSEEVTESTSDENVVSLTSSEETLSDTEVYNRHLQSRIASLRDTIGQLKEQLREEREIWKRQIEDKKEFDYYAQIAPIEPYYDYQHDMQRYQDTILQQHFENRHNLQKQLAVANYKRRLLEVENMCNLELMRVKHSVQILQPLQLIASEWKITDHYDAKATITEIKEGATNKTEVSEVDMPLEAVRGQLKKMEAPCNMTQSEPVITEILGEGDTVKCSKSQPAVIRDGND